MMTMDTLDVIALVLGGIAWLFVMPPLARFIPYPTDGENILLLLRDYFNYFILPWLVFGVLWVLFELVLNVIVRLATGAWPS